LVNKLPTATFILITGHTAEHLGQQQKKKPAAKP